MPEDVSVVAAPEMAVDGGAPLGATPPVEPAQPQQTQSQRVQSVTAEPRVVSVPTAAMKRIKDEAREAGRAEALAALAQSAGFSDPDELASTLKQLRSGGQTTRQAPAPRQTQQPAPPAHDTTSDEVLEVKNARREMARYERQMEKLARERDQYLQQYQQANQQAYQLQESLDAKEAEMSLREVAVTSGVKDVDYALRLLTRELENKTEDELAAFDERGFFDGLRKQKPYLFGELTQPATTGTGVSAPTAPRASQVSAQGASAAGKVDARRMNQQEYADLLRKRGLNPNL